MEDPRALIETILATELRKLEAASKLPHCMTAEQVANLATLARIYRQNPEAPPPAPKDELEGVSAEDLIKALKGGG